MSTPAPELIASVLRELGVDSHPRVVSVGTPGPSDESQHTVRSPIDASPLATIRLDDSASYESAMLHAQRGFDKIRRVPAPARGLLVRDIADEFRKAKLALAKLITLEVGKILQESQGEVQETIDIADFAVGLSRQLYGLTMPSEREQHKLLEQWHPLGVVGVISAFNFPNAVWAWNAMLAAVCGDSVVWKPSLLAPLTAIASNAIAQRVAARHDQPDLFTLVMGVDQTIGERLIADRRMPLISATGSCAMGARVGTVVAQRLGTSLLELGGNNAAIITESADLSIAIPAVVFAAAGTCGQRCTTTRRLIVHESIADIVVEKLARAYRSIRIGNPLDASTLVGPLVNARAVEGFERAVRLAKEQGAEVVVGGARANVPGCAGGHFVQPTIVRAPSHDLPIAREETFAPILYVFTYRTLQEAIDLNNSVAQGLSSSIFTDRSREAELFLSALGSDCGIANVNAGTSGAEIGGAFGGEKDTGRGRESGSDSWKAYMRRQTCTVNYGSTVRLAQGIHFD
jgi:aldehyde dehydrogenase (NAD+)